MAGVVVSGNHPYDYLCLEEGLRLAITQWINAYGS